MADTATSFGIGDTVPSFSLTDTEGARHDVPAEQAPPATVLIQTCNHCPYVIAWNPRLRAVAEEYGPRGVRFLAISSNNPETHPADSPERMAQFVREHDWPIPYAFDESQDVARALGAERTPELFVLDWRAAARVPRRARFRPRRPAARTPPGCAPRSTPSWPARRPSRPRRPRVVARSNGDRQDPIVARRVNEHSIALAHEWRRLGRAATAVAVLTSPALFLALYDRFEWPLFWAIVGTVFGVAAFRGLVDVLAHRLIPAPSLYGAEKELREEDVIWRRRLWYWRRKYRIGLWLLAIFVGGRAAVGRDQLDHRRRHVDLGRLRGGLATSSSRSCRR